MSANRLTGLQHISQNSFWSNNDWIFSDISQLSAIWTFCITAEVELGSPRSVRMAAAPAAVTGRSVSRSWPGCWLVAATAHARTQVNPVLRNPRTRKLNYTGTFYEKWECILLMLKINIFGFLASIGAQGVTICVRLVLTCLKLSGMSKVSKDFLAYFVL